MERTLKAGAAALLGGVLLLFFSTQTEFKQGTQTRTQTQAPPPALGRSGMVSSAHALATGAGLNILKRGGSAFDAAVSVAAVLNVVEPMMSGMGGYGTILIYSAEERRVRYLDSSGKIPAAVDSDVYRSPTPGYLENRSGAKAVSTPGNVNAWEALWQSYGRLSWKSLFDQAVVLADQGFILEQGTAGSISRAYDSFPLHARLIYGQEGRPLQAGERLVQKDLAQSLRLVADQGAKAVYGGILGRAIDTAMKKSGGFLALTDLVNDKAEWWEPIHISYRECEVYTAAPPATAFPSLIRLGIMSRFDTTEKDHNSAAYLHRFAESSKHAFWCRLVYAGDPDIQPPPLGKLLSEEYWEAQAAKIQPGAASDFVPPGNRIKQGINTTHFVVADKWGNIVSATQTLGNAFGSRILPEGTGIWLNNSLAYCTFEPKGNPMDAHAGHRKLSGDCPTIILKQGKPWAALGTPGGHTIGQTVPQMIMNLIDFKMDIRAALAAPRISFMEPDTLAVESGILGDVIVELEKRGHLIRTGARLGNAHGLTLVYDRNGRVVRFSGASDPRGRGLAQGY